MHTPRVGDENLSINGVAAGSGALPQPMIEPLTQSLTRRALDALSFPNARDEDGDWFTVIPGREGRSQIPPRPSLHQCTLKPTLSRTHQLEQH
jgi:hypothetical protein